MSGSAPPAGTGLSWLHASVLVQVHPSPEAVAPGNGAYSRTLTCPVEACNPEFSTRAVNEACCPAASGSSPDSTTARSTGIPPTAEPIEDSLFEVLASESLVRLADPLTL